MASLAANPLTQVRLFGAGVIERGGRPLATRTRKELHLLALLLLRHDRPSDRDWLAEELWPESAQPLYNLSRSLANLKSVLGGDEIFQIEKPTPRTLRLRPDALEVDLLTFDTLIRQGTPAALAAAVDLYCGPLLKGCMDDWIIAEREAREQSCIRALRELADVARSQSDLATADNYLRRARAIDPLNEETVRALMQTLADQGEMAAANQVYRKLRQGLSEQLLPGPDPRTHALFESLQNGARAAGPRSTPSVEPPSADPSSRVPKPVHRLIGREREVWEVSACLTQSRLVTLTGIGGTGKTRLSIAVAEECAGEYAQGACFVDLSALSDAKLVIHAVAESLGVREIAGQDLLQTVQTYLKEQSLLLILDNCEHLRAASAALCEALLPHCPSLRILATSREPLGLTPEIETVWRVPALALPPLPVRARDAGTDRDAHAALGRLLAWAAIRLFVERARQALPGFSVDPSNLEPVVQICRRLDGNALAIELAAARVCEMSADQIAARLDDRFQLLQNGKRSVPRRQQALQASMDWSYDLLTLAERTLLHRLSVFAGGWTLSAAEAVCGDFGFWILDFGLSNSTSDEPTTGLEGIQRNDSVVSQHTPNETSVIQNPKSKIQNQEVLDLLSSLVDKSLVVRDDQDRTVVRFRLLESVREYARKRLTTSGEAEAVRRRHRDYFLKLAEDGVDKVPAWKMWLGRIEREHDNCRAALDFCANDSHRSSDSADAGLRLATAMHRFWEDCGHFTEGRARLGAALARAATRPPTIAYARALCVAGTLANFQGDYQVARSQLEQALRLARELQNWKVAASVLANLGTNCWWQGDYEQAQAFYEESLTHMQEAEAHIASTVLSNLGEIAREQGDYARARSLLEESLTRARRVGDPSVVVTPLTGLGNVAHNQGDFRTAQAIYTEALALTRDLGDPWRIALLLGNLGSVAQAQGDYAAALAPFEECLALLQRLGDKRNSATALIELASLHYKTGDSDRARIRLSDSLGILRETGDRFFMGAALITCASIAYRQRQMEWAAALFGAAEALHKEMGASLPPLDAEECRREIEGVRATLDTAVYERWRAVGQECTLDKAGALGLDFLNGAPLPE